MSSRRNVTTVKPVIATPQQLVSSGRLVGFAQAVSAEFNHRVSFMDPTKALASTIGDCLDGLAREIEDLRETRG